MGNKKFVVVDVLGFTSSELEDRLNQLNEQGYIRVFESSIQWYQGKGEWGVITFELKEE